MALNQHSSTEENNEYHAYKVVSSICSMIDRVGLKLSRKVTHKDYEKIRPILHTFLRQGDVLPDPVLKDAFVGFMEEINALQSDIFPMGVQESDTEISVLSPMEMENTMANYKHMLKSRVPQIEKCTFSMLCDILMRVELESFAWLLTDLFYEKLEFTRNIPFTKQQEKTYRVFMYRRVLLLLKAFVARIESNPDLVPSLSVHPNIRKFSEGLQSMEATLVDIAFVTYNRRTQMTGMLTMNDQLSVEELFKDFVDIAANKSDPSDQNVHILFLSSELEQRVREFYSQKISDTLSGMTWAHTDIDNIRFWVTEFFVDYLRKSGFTSSSVTAWHIPKESLSENGYAAITVDPQSGLYVDIVDPDEEEPFTVLEVDL